jgi:Family of unknown function (DUF5923)
MSIEAHNFIKFSPYSAITDEHHHEFTLTFGQMQADMRDVAFYFRRKTGIRLSDSGLADIVLGGEGLTVSFPTFRYENSTYTLMRCRPLYISFLPTKINPRSSKSRTSSSRSTPSSSPFATLNTTCCTKPSGHSQLRSSRSRSRKPLRTRLLPVWNTSTDSLSA